MTSKEMMRAEAKPGYWFVNVARLGERPDWQERVAPHDSGLLFGHRPSDLLAMQYKR